MHRKRTQLIDGGPEFKVVSPRRFVLSTYAFGLPDGTQTEVLDQHVSLMVSFGHKPLYRVKYYLKGYKE